MPSASRHRRRHEEVQAVAAEAALQRGQDALVVVVRAFHGEGLAVTAEADDTRLFQRAGMVRDGSEVRMGLETEVAGVGDGACSSSLS